MYELAGRFKPFRGLASGRLALKDARLRARQSQRLRQPLRVSAALGGGDGGNAGFLWSDDLDCTVETPQGQQVRYLVRGDSNNTQLVLPAVEQFLKQFAEQDGQESRLWETTTSSGDELVLQQRIAQLKRKERGKAVQELLQLCCVHKLRGSGLALVKDITQLGPEASGHPPGMVRQSSLPSLFSSQVCDVITAYTLTTMGPQLRESAPHTCILLDRTQAARLYAGIVEFGCFARQLEERCAALGVKGDDSSAMIEFAAQIDSAEVRRMCRVRTQEGWLAAVRRAGRLFRLRQREEEGAAVSADATELPYPELATTIATLQVQPAAAVWDHFAAPAEAERRRAADSARARGWSADTPAAQPLPPPDLLEFRLELLHALLLEACAYGCLLWDMEQVFEKTFRYTLTPRSDTSAPS